MTSEEDFLQRLQERLGDQQPAPPPGTIGVGDDTAVFPDGRLLATDMLIDGVHFRQEWTTPEQIAVKALAVNLSDIAAMGGTPEAAVVAVAVPRGSGIADRLATGLIDAARRWRCPIVGGDTTSGPNLVISVAVTGHVAPGAAVLRSGGRPGDTVFVSGELGGAGQALDDLAAGRTPSTPNASRLHDPEPRLRAGRAALEAGATAMLDLSDGLSTDLLRLARASRIGAVLEADAVPVAEGTNRDRALRGGDDYELCFTAPDPSRVMATFAAAELPAPTAVGRLTATPDVWIVAADGSRERLTPTGWDHLIG